MVRQDSVRRPLIAAAAIIAGPILVAALSFQLRAPGRGPGVYVESETGAVTSTHSVPGSLVAELPAPSAVSVNTLVVRAGGFRSFFVVDTPPPRPAATATAPALYFFVVNNADETFRSELLPVPSTIRQINSRVYQVTFKDVEPERLGLTYYRQVLAGAAGSRATMELILGLLIQDSSGQRRMYSVRMAGP